jgi:integrase
MRGSIVKRSKTSWALVVDQGRDATGKRRQKWVKFEVPRGVSQRDAQKQAESKLAELLHQIDKGTYVDASKTTLIEYLRSWHSKNVAPHRRPETTRIYLSMIDRHVATAPIATLPLQKVSTSDLERLYASVKLSPRSVTVLHAVIGRALKIAVRDKLLVANPATAVEDRPRPTKDKGHGARAHCWSADEARRVLSAAKSAGSQVSAFVALLLDTGARKSEALGLTWEHVDLDAGTVTIAQQLAPRCGERPVFGPTKTGTSRTITLGTETIARLRAHRKHQRELLMANRMTYQDHGLVFAKEPVDLQKPTAALGQPCLALVDRYFRLVIKAAGVKPIKVHGTRHTTATLLLAAGVPLQVVAQRLGHASVAETGETYAHALPDMQRDAAAKLGALLAGR